MPIHNRGYKDQNLKESPQALAAIGPVEAVEVHVPDALAKALTKAGSPIPPPQAGLALIDTGATLTAVHEPALQALGLNPIGTVQLGTAGGSGQRYMYPGKINFPGMNNMEIGLNQVTGVDLSKQIVQLPTGPQQLLVLVGRDILSRCILIYNGSAGTWSLAL